MLVYHAIILQKFLRKSWGILQNDDTQKDLVSPYQGDLFKLHLRDLVNPSHPMVRLADKVDWKQFEDAMAPVFADGQGRPSADVRLVIGLLDLKVACDLSDADVVAI